jgi:hypothetical protein
VKTDLPTHGSIQSADTASGKAFNLNFQYCGDDSSICAAVYRIATVLDGSTTFRCLRIGHSQAQSLNRKN